VVAAGIPPTNQSSVGVRALTRRHGHDIVFSTTTKLMTDDFHLYRTGRWQKWQATAEYVRKHPESLEIPLANIERWLMQGRLHPAPLLEWRRRIRCAQSSPEEFTNLLAYLAANNFDSEPLKSCSPFIGMAAEGLVTRP